MKKIATNLFTLIFVSSTLSAIDLMYFSPEEIKSALIKLKEEKNIDDQMHQSLELKFNTENDKEYNTSMMQIIGKYHELLTIQRNLIQQQYLPLEIIHSASDENLADDLEAYYAESKINPNVIIDSNNNKVAMDFVIERILKNGSIDLEPLDRLAQIGGRPSDQMIERLHELKNNNSEESLHAQIIVDQLYEKCQ